MSRAALLLVALASVGCAGSLDAARAEGRALRAGSMSAVVERPLPSERCVTLDDRRAFYGGLGKSLALAGGAAGISTIPAEDERLQTGLAIGSLVSAAAAAGAIYISERAGDSWSRECASE